MACFMLRRKTFSPAWEYTSCETTIRDGKCYWWNEYELKYAMLLCNEKYILWKWGIFVCSCQNIKYVPLFDMILNCSLIIMIQSYFWILWKFLHLMCASNEQEIEIGFLSSVVWNVENIILIFYLHENFYCHRLETYQYTIS